MPEITFTPTTIDDEDRIYLDIPPLSSTRYHLVKPAEEWIMRDEVEGEDISLSQHFRCTDESDAKREALRVIAAQLLQTIKLIHRTRAEL